MKLRNSLIAATAGACLIAVTPAIASAKTINVTPGDVAKALQQQKDAKACSAAAHAGKKVTKAIRRTCLDDIAVAKIPCPNGQPPVDLFAVGKNNNYDTYYLMQVGRRPEKADEPEGAQVAYVCAHGTLLGAPAPFTS